MVPSFQNIQIRFVRTGFFRSDPDFIDPESVLFAESVEDFQHADDGTLRAGLLERCNVGMGLFLINRPEGLDLPTVNRFYRKLRDAEVNTLKRYCVIASRAREHFSQGIDKRELLMTAEASQVLGGPVQMAIDLLGNMYELSYVVHSYYKPLFSVLSGHAEDGGGALCFLANRSAVFKGASYTCNSQVWGWIPDAGMSHVLGRLRGSLGVYLATTGQLLTGADLIWAGLARHWVSPEAIPFMEITSEKQLEVSEQDAKLLLEEHYLPVPGTGVASDPYAYPLKTLEAVIHHFFNKNTLTEVVEDLERHVSENGPHAKWAQDTLYAFEQRSPLALAVTFELIRRVKKARAQVLREAGVTPQEWKDIRALEGKTPTTGEESSMLAVYEALEDRSLVEALTLEKRAAVRMLLRPDLVEGLRSFVTRSCDDFYPPQWQYKTIREVSANEVASFFEPFDNDLLEFCVHERGEFPLSAHPRLRKLNPDYDPKTGFDHDPDFMAREMVRWSDDFHAAERVQLKALLTDSPMLRDRAMTSAKKLGIMG